VERCNLNQSFTGPGGTVKGRVREHREPLAMDSSEFRKHAHRPQLQQRKADHNWNWTARAAALPDEELRISGMTIRSNSTKQISLSGAEARDAREN